MTYIKSFIRIERLFLIHFLILIVALVILFCYYVHELYLLALVLFLFLLRYLLFGAILLWNIIIHHVLHLIMVMANAHWHIFRMHDWIRWLELSLLEFIFLKRFFSNSCYCHCCWRYSCSCLLFLCSFILFFFILVLTFKGGWPLTIVAVHTFAFVLNTWHSSLIALTVFLLTFRIFAIAAFKMLILLNTDFLFKCIHISFKDFLNSFLSLTPLIWFVRAIFLITLTFRTTCSFISQTITIKL